MSDAAILAEMSKPARRELFLSRLVEMDGCHVWTMAANPRGYGVFRIGVRGERYTCSAHRVAWMLASGLVIPKGHEVDHLCRNPPCCNPAHLEAVVRRENITRVFGRSLVNAPAVVRDGKRSVHVRRRARGDRFLVTWRQHLADGSVVQRGQQFDSREAADAFVAR